MMLTAYLQVWVEGNESRPRDSDCESVRSTHHLGTCFHLWYIHTVNPEILAVI